MLSNYQTYPDSSLKPDQLKATLETVSKAQHLSSISHEQFAIETARKIAPHTEELFENEPTITPSELKKASSITQRHLLQIRKISEIYADQWQIHPPSGSLYKTAKTLGKVTSVGGILIGLKGVHETATSIKSTHKNKGKSAIKDSQIRDFYFASAVLFGELVLMATPISTRFAFQATGRLHSYLLWQRFHNHRAIYRLLLHHAYYMIKGIPSLAIHEAQSVSQRVDRFVSSIVFVIKTTWESFSEPAFLDELTSVEIRGGFFTDISDLDLSDLQSQIGEEYRQLREYISSILSTLEEHYVDLYNRHLDTQPTEVIAMVIKQLLHEL